MNEFVIHDASAETVIPSPTQSVVFPAPQVTPPADSSGVRQVPVEDLGLGIARLVKDGVAGAASLGNVDALSAAAKKASQQLTGGVNQLVHKATEAVGRCRAGKE